MEYRNTKDLKPLPNNPRLQKDSTFEELCKSIQDDPEYFEARPLILSDRTGELIVIAGNQRYKAAKHLKLKKVPTHLMTGLTAERERKITLLDNVHSGSFDFEVLDDWDCGLLKEWEVDFPSFDTEDEKNYSDKNKEIKTEEFSDKMTIKLDYTEEDYHRVKEAFLNIGGTPEKIIWQLLKLDDVAF